MCLLQNLFEHFFLFFQYANGIFLFFEIVLHVVVFPLFLFGLFGLLACLGEVHDSALVFLDDPILLLQLVLVVSLDVDLVPLQLEDLARALIQLLLHARVAEPCLRQLL